MSTRGEGRAWGVSLLLLAPAMIPYATHFGFWKPYSIPTGYIQNDMPVYMAKAREYFDGGGFHLFYGNPCGANQAEPRIYFQPWTWLLGLVHHISGVRPRTVFVGFWFLAAWCGVRAALALYRECVGMETRAKRWGLIGFLWGGGGLSLAGLIATAWRGEALSWEAMLRFDPAQGWWFLNLGRNLVYPTESLYHALTFACLVSVIQGRKITSLGLAGLTAACSPFAGLGLLATLTGWGILEVILTRRIAWWLAGMVILDALFVAYYSLFLGLFPEHRKLAQVMALDWPLPLIGVALAGVWVAPFVATRFCSRARFELPARDRLLLIWGIVTLVLSHHGWLVAPRQPIHFARGYTWTAFYLLAAPTAIPIVAGWWRSRRQPGRVAVVALMLGLFSDNATWFTRFVAEARVPDRNGLRVSTDGEAVLQYLASRADFESIVVSEDERLGYLAVAETPARAWVGHWLETPEYSARRSEQAAFFRNFTFLDAWRGRTLWVIRYRRTSGANSYPGAVLALSNRTFELYRVAPGTITGRTGRARSVPAPDPPGPASRGSTTGPP